MSLVAPTPLGFRRSRSPAPPARARPRRLHAFCGIAAAAGRPQPRRRPAVDRAAQRLGLRGNNYRQNRQGDVTAADLPDITGALDPQSCMGGGGKVILTSSVCNRGKKSVGANLPATFYRGDPADGDILCVAYTAEPVPIGECRDVSCEIDSSVDGVVTVVVDDDGQGGQVALECFENNNTDTIEIKDCNPVG